MRIVEIAALDNGAHRNQTISGGLASIPVGWAVIPEGLETEGFPYGALTVEERDGLPTVAEWVPGVVPEAAPQADPAPTRMDVMEAQLTYTAMMTDTLLEE